MEKDFFKDQYFCQLNDRLDTLEKKIDELTAKVVWVYAFSAGFGSVAAFIINNILK